MLGQTDKVFVIEHGILQYQFHILSFCDMCSDLSEVGFHGLRKDNNLQI